MDDYENPNQRGLRAMMNFFGILIVSGIVVGGLVIAGIVWAVWAWWR